MKWKVATFNVNGVRSRQQAVISWIEQNKPDVLCLQEIKCRDFEFPVDPIQEIGYEASVYGQKSFHGVATLSLKKPDEVRRGFSDGQPDEEARLIADDKFPLILMAGRHMDMNANTGMRDPAWNEGRRACTLAINPADAEKYGFSDRQMVKIITEAGEETLEVEVTEDARKGQVIIPHGFGLVYNGVKFGANVNRLAKNTNRDRFGTPMHRYVPCRVEAA